MQNDHRSAWYRSAADLLGSAASWKRNGLWDQKALAEKSAQFSQKKPVLIPEMQKSMQINVDDLNAKRERIN